ncbi:MAG TPA: asparagine synthase-related protein [Steroidobacteraceae bacterium]|jgi:asparagine synthase (glutamine-hydrolysing)
MYRYLALIWNPADREAAMVARGFILRAGSALPDWRRALEVDGLTVMHFGDGQGEAQTGNCKGASETRLLEGSRGVVLGTIFNRDIGTVQTANSVRFDETETTQLLRTGGERFFSHYWGRYVAILRDPAAGEISVLRDPLGQMPCLLTQSKGVRVVFSDLEDCLKLGGLSFSVNWSYVERVLTVSTSMSEQTGLNEVSEIQLGERVRFRGDSIQRATVYRPFEIARTDPILDVGAAVGQLRSTVRACVHAWASRYSGLIHNLSGGLDSSIVLSCLKSAPTAPPVTCLNYYGTGPYEDERPYARLTAQHFGSQLVEYPLNPADVKLDRVTTVKRSARPWFYMYELEHGEYENQLAEEHGANGLFSGAGGDGIFFQTHADLAVADYLFDHGLGAGLFQAATDAARMAGKSIWPLLFNALRARLFPTRWNPVRDSHRPQSNIVSEAVARAAAREQGFNHPWFTREATRGVSPGLLWHVACVSAPPQFYGFLTEMPERTLPLVSQPLVELCLRMPTYMLIRSGRDRAIARRAFAADLPQQTTGRVAKGRIDQHVRNVLDANLPFVRELLLDGQLVSRGLLDRKALEKYLTRERSPADFQYGIIFQEHLCIEAWLRRSADLPRTAPVVGAGTQPQGVTSSCGSAG